MSLTQIMKMIVNLNIIALSRENHEPERETSTRGERWQTGPNKSLKQSRFKIPKNYAGGGTARETAFRFLGVRARLDLGNCDPRFYVPRTDGHHANAGPPGWSTRRVTVVELDGPPRQRARPGSPRSSA